MILFLIVLLFVCLFARTKLPEVSQPTLQGTNSIGNTNQNSVGGCCWGGGCRVGGVRGWVGFVLLSEALSLHIMCVI